MSKMQLCKMTVKKARKFAVSGVLHNNIIFLHNRIGDLAVG